MDSRSIQSAAPVSGGETRAAEILILYFVQLLCPEISIACLLFAFYCRAKLNCSPRVMSVCIMLRLSQGSQELSIVSDTVKQSPG